MGAYHRHLGESPTPGRHYLMIKKGQVHNYARRLYPSPNMERLSTKHITAAASKQIATSISLRRHDWLRSVNISDDAKARIEDRPFDGDGLFDGKTDDVLKSLQECKKTARAYSNQNTFRTYRPTWRRSTYQFNR